MAEPTLLQDVIEIVQGGFARPQSLWQLAVIGVGLAVGWMVARTMRHRVAARVAAESRQPGLRTELLRFSVEGIRRLAFPVSALFAMVAGGLRPGEERAVVIAFVYFFLLLSSYYLLRPVRDAMAAHAGLGRLPELFTYTFIAMLAITPLFGALVSRVRKRLLLPTVYGFFAANMFLFYLAFDADPGSQRAAATFFVWLSVFNMFVVSVFWSFMADVFRGEEARRLFGPIAAGGNAGAIVGPLLTRSPPAWAPQASSCSQ